MKRIAICLAPALLFAAGHATAAGPLLAGLQPRLNATAPALTASALSALPTALSSSTTFAAPASSLFSASALPGLPEGNTYWLEYNLNTYPTYAGYWSDAALAVTQEEVGHFMTTLTTVPGPGEACDASTCPINKTIRAYATNLGPGATRMVGLVHKIPAPPQPVMPPFLTPFWNKTWNYTVGNVFGPAYAP